MIDLGGFSMSESTRLTMIVIFGLYSLLIVGLGAYVKISSRRMQNDSLSSFLTGGGGLGAFSIAMIECSRSVFFRSWTTISQSGPNCAARLLARWQ